MISEELATFEVSCRVPAQWTYVRAWAMGEAGWIQWFLVLIFWSGEGGVRAIFVHEDSTTCYSEIWLRRKGARNSLILDSFSREKS